MTLHPLHEGRIAMIIDAKLMVIKMKLKIFRLKSKTLWVRIYLNIENELSGHEFYIISTRFAYSNLQNATIGNRTVIFCYTTL